MEAEARPCERESPTMSWRGIINWHGKPGRLEENCWALVPGGFLLLSCALQKQEQVREALASLREMPVTLTETGSEVVHNDGMNATGGN
jgi:hypothetical protein